MPMPVLLFALAALTACDDQSAVDDTASSSAWQVTEVDCPLEQYGDDPDVLYVTNIGELPPAWDVQACTGVDGEYWCYQIPKATVTEGGDVLLFDDEYGSCIYIRVAWSY